MEDVCTLSLVFIVHAASGLYMSGVAHYIKTGKDRDITWSLIDGAEIGSHLDTYMYIAQLLATGEGAGI